MDIKELLKQLSLAELKALKTHLPKELVKRTKKDQITQIRELRQKAQFLGVKVIVKSKLPKKAMYVHPNDADLTWVGSGRKPKWVKKWEAENGGSLDKLRIK